MWAKHDERKIRRPRNTSLCKGPAVHDNEQCQPTDLTMKRLMALSLGMALAVDAQLQHKMNKRASNRQNTRWMGGKNGGFRKRHHKSPERQSRGGDRTQRTRVSPHGRDTMVDTTPADQKGGVRLGFQAYACTTQQWGVRGAMVQTTHADRDNARRSAQPRAVRRV